MRTDRVAAGFAGAAVAVACGGGDNGPASPPPSPVVTAVEIAPPSSTVLTALGASVRLDVTARDQNGAPIDHPTVTWSSLDPGVATVDGSGLVIGRDNGSAPVTASAGDVADTVTIVVNQVVAAVRITPLAPVLELPGDTLIATGQPVDSRGNDVVGAGAVSWGATGAITVQPSGRVEAVTFGAGTLTATAEGVSSSATAEVIGDRFFLSQGTRMRYDLDIPLGSGPFPGIVFVHGSGMVNRNTQRDATDPLVPEGVAVLRYDKRGVGESGGVYLNIGVANSGGALEILADDAANALRFLARQTEIDPTRLGIMGNSQGGWIVPMAAHKAAAETRFIMLWSGPTVSVGLEIFYSNLAEGTTTPLDDVYPQLANFTGPDGYESLPDIASLDIPGIWQYGELDRSIPMRLDVERLTALQAQGKPFELVVWEFGDHALRDTRINQFYDVWSEYVRFMRDIGVLPPGP